MPGVAQLIRLGGAMTQTENTPSYRPQSYYFRAALNDSPDIDEARRVGRMAVDELEYRNEQLRALGHIPSRLYSVDDIKPDSRQMYLLPPLAGERG